MRSRSSAVVMTSRTPTASAIKAAIGAVDVIGCAARCVRFKNVTTNLGARQSFNQGVVLMSILIASETNGYFCRGEADFWNRGSFRRGSNIGSIRSRAVVSGTFSAGAPVPGTESSFSKAAMLRSGSPIRVATHAKISIDREPAKASFSIGLAAIAPSARDSAAVLSPRPILTRARWPMS